jgi:hypothetical protein
VDLSAAVSCACVIMVALRFLVKSLQYSSSDCIPFREHVRQSSNLQRRRQDPSLALNVTSHSIAFPSKRTHLSQCRSVVESGSEAPTVLPESEISGLSAFLDSLKWDSDGLVAAIVQVHLFCFFECLMDVSLDENLTLCCS